MTSPTQQILFVLPERDTAVTESSIDDVCFFTGVQVIRYKPTTLGGLSDFLLQCSMQRNDWLNKTVLFCPGSCHIIGFENILQELLELKNQSSMLWKLADDAACTIGFVATQENLRVLANNFLIGNFISHIPLHSYRIVEAKKRNKDLVQNFLSQAGQHFTLLEAKFSSRQYYASSDGPPDVIFDDLHASSVLDGVTTRLQEKLSRQFRRTLALGRDVCFVAISEGSDYERLEGLFFENYSDYCSSHGYSLFLYRSKLLKNATANWSKAAFLDIILGQFSHVVFVDIDTAIVKNNPVHELFSSEMSSKSILFFQDPGEWDFNSGSIILRNDAFSREFLRNWKSKCSSLAQENNHLDVYAHGGDQHWAIVSKRLLPSVICETMSHTRGWNVHPNYSNSSTTMVHFMGLGNPSTRTELIKYYLEEARSKSTVFSAEMSNKG